MSLPKLYIRLIGHPAVEFRYDDGRPTKVFELGFNYPDQILIDLAMRSESFDAFVLRSALKLHPTTLDRELSSLRKWLKKVSGDAKAETKSYVGNPSSQKGGLCLNRDLCDTDLREFKNALVSVRQKITAQSIMELRRHVERIGESRLLHQLDDSRNCLIEVAPHREEFTRDLAEANSYLQQAIVYPQLPPAVGSYAERHEMRKINQWFGRVAPARIPIIGIMGMSGVGKTSAAAEYAYRNLNKYDFILWFEAYDVNVFQSQYVDLAEWLGLAPAFTPLMDLELSLRPVKEWLARTRNYLLVFDDLISAFLLDNYLPSNPAGHILVTTRLPSLGLRYAERIDLGRFTPSQGLRYLCMRLALNYDEPRRLRETPALQGIVRTTEGLPLDLAVAASKLIESRQDVSRYAEELEKLYRDASWGDSDGSVVNTNKSASIRLSFDELPAAVQDLLRLLSFMGDAPFRTEWLKAGRSDELGDVLNTAISRNYQFAWWLDFCSLCKCTSDSFRMHGRGRATVQAFLSEDERKTWMHRTVVMLNTNLPDYTFEERHRYKDLLPHLLHMCLVDEKQIWDDERMARVLHYTGRYLTEHGMTDTARVCLARSLAIRRKFRGESAIPLMHTHCAVVDYYLGIEQRHKALKHATAAHLIARDYLPEGDEWWPIICEKMAYCLSGAGKLAEAERFVRQGLNAPSGPKTPWLWNTLGVIQQRREQFAEAHSSYKSAIDEHKRVNPEQQAPSAFCYTNMGVASARLGKFERSREGAEQAITFFERTCGKDSREYAIARLDFASGRAYEGCWPEALEAARGAFEIRMRCYGETSSATHDAALAMVCAHIHLNMYREAIDLMDRLDEIVLRCRVVLLPNTRQFAAHLRGLLAERIENSESHPVRVPGC